MIVRQIAHDCVTSQVHMTVQDSGGACLFTPQVITQLVIAVLKAYQLHLPSCGRRRHRRVRQSHAIVITRSARLQCNSSTVHVNMNPPGCTCYSYGEKPTSSSILKTFNILLCCESRFSKSARSLVARESIDLCSSPSNLRGHRESPTSWTRPGHTKPAQSCGFENTANDVLQLPKT